MNKEQGSFYLIPSLMRYLREKGINPSRILELALLDFKEKGYANINQREVIKKTRKEKDLIGNGSTKQPAG